MCAVVFVGKRLGVHLFFVQFTTVGRPRTGAGLRTLDGVNN